MRSRVRNCVSVGAFHILDANELVERHLTIFEPTNRQNLPPRPVNRQPGEFIPLQINTPINPIAYYFLKEQHTYCMPADMVDSGSHYVTQEFKDLFQEIRGSEFMNRRRLSYCECFDAITDYIVHFRERLAVVGRLDLYNISQDPLKRFIHMNFVHKCQIPFLVRNIVVMENEKLIMLQLRNLSLNRRGTGAAPPQ